MIKLSDLITRLRAMTHDEREIEYSDEDWIRFANDGLRFVRRIILDTYPAALADMEMEGILTPPEKTIYLYDQPLHILSVKINGERLKIVNPLTEDEDKYKHRDPFGWYLMGFERIRIVPAPKFPVYYEVSGVMDFQPLKSPDDTLPIPADFEDFISEYCVMRASVTNEFNMQEETQLTMYIRSGIEERLKAFLPSGVVIRGYW